MVSAIYLKYLSLCLFLLTQVLFNKNAFAEDTGKDNLSSLQEEIEHSLVAPCCWNMTVDQHDSPASRKVREEIAKRLERGESKDQILDYFVSQPEYGERILAAPSQKTLLGKAAYWLIPVAFLFGMIVVGKTLRRLSHPAQKQRRDQGSEHDVARQEPSPSKWNDRFEKELRDFDD